MQAPFYKDNATELYMDDCVAGMKELPEGLYDCLFTSPPYNIGKSYEENMPLGDYLKLLADFTHEAYRVIKKGGYMVINYADYYMFDGGNTQIQPMTYLYHLISERSGWKHMCTRIWKKDYASLIDPYTINSTLPKLEHEYLATFRKPGGGKETVREQDLHTRSVWSTQGDKQSTTTMKHHKAAFPEALVAMVLTVYTDNGDTVIEPFAGSGTTLVVAKRMGRKGVGFELKEDYCQLAATRLSQQEFPLDVPILTKQMALDEAIRLQQVQEEINAEHEGSNGKVVRQAQPESQGVATGVPDDF